MYGGLETGDTLIHLPQGGAHTGCPDTPSLRGGGDGHTGGTPVYPLGGGRGTILECLDIFSLGVLILGFPVLGAP